MRRRIGENFQCRPRLRRTIEVQLDDFQRSYPRPPEPVAGPAGTAAARQTVIGFAHRLSNELRGLSNADPLSAASNQGRGDVEYGWGAGLFEHTLRPRDDTDPDRLQQRGGIELALFSSPHDDHTFG